MPRQVYRCEVHGEFEVSVPFGEDVPMSLPCEHVMGERMTHWYCMRESPWVPSLPSISVKDGTTPPR